MDEQIFQFLHDRCGQGPARVLHLLDKWFQQQIELDGDMKQTLALSRMLRMWGPNAVMTVEPVDGGLMMHVRCVRSFFEDDVRVAWKWSRGVVSTPLANLTGSKQAA